MSRIAVLLEYDGTGYAGWQRQLNAVTVQQRVEEAMLALTGEAVAVVGASRTDAGVHARGQVFHADVPEAIPPERFFLALNTKLPADIRARASGRVSSVFHARFHAVGKEYRYRIHNAPALSALGRNQRAHVPVPLDVERMNRAIQPILGTHDFRAFCAAGSAVRDKTRTMRAASVRREGEECVVFSIEGRGFLYNMVRILAGTLIEIGKGKLAPEAVAEALHKKDRLLAGPTAPAHGLCLERVEYRGAGQIYLSGGVDKA